MSYCLIPSLVEKFKKSLIGGEIDPAKLSNMTSAERHEFFSKIVGEADAKSVNSLFESKLLLKNKELGFINWAKTLTGIKPEVKQDILSKIEKWSKKGILNADSEEKFLQDLASTRLGADVTFEEAKAITDLSEKMAEFKGKLNDKGESRQYGLAKASMEKYISDLKLKGKETTVTGAIKDVAGAAKGIKATLDNSGLFRQGWKTLWTNPVKWAENSAKSFKYIGKTFKGEDVMLGVKADIYAKKYAIDGTFKKMKLDIGDMEEAFPSTLPEKIPLFKTLYKASENAYTGFLYGLRADIATKMLDLAKTQGIDIADKAQLESIGKLVNSLTGRGNLGNFEMVGKELNNFFFSPKFLKSNIDFLTAHQLQKGVTPFVRKQAAKNLLKVIAGTGAVLATANALKPGSVDFDPRSTKFGKIKAGDTTFDVTGGMGSIVTLVSRIVTGSSKNSTGKVSKLNSGFGSQNGMDVFWQFWEGKLSPTAGLARDLINQSDFMGNKLTVSGELLNTFLPMPIATGIELYQNPNAAPFLLSMIADGLGISTNTTPIASPKDWTQNPGVELQQFQDKVGKDKFKQANEEYNALSNEKLMKVVVDERYKKLSDEEKQKVVTKLKENAKSEIFKKYRFTYKPETTKKNPAIDQLTK